MSGAHQHKGNLFRIFEPKHFQVQLSHCEPISFNGRVMTHKNILLKLCEILANITNCYVHNVRVAIKIPELSEFLELDQNVILFKAQSTKEFENKKCQ